MGSLTLTGRPANASSGVGVVDVPMTPNARRAAPRHGLAGRTGGPTRPGPPRRRRATRPPSRPHRASDQATWPRRHCASARSSGGEIPVPVGGRPARVRSLCFPPALTHLTGQPHVGGQRRVRHPHQLGLRARRLQNLLDEQAIRRRRALGDGECLALVRSPRAATTAAATSSTQTRLNRRPPAPTGICRRPARSRRRMNSNLRCSSCPHGRRRAGGSWRLELRPGDVLLLRSGADSSYGTASVCRSARTASKAR